jgi:hypothetical protein
MPRNELLAIFDEGVGGEEALILLGLVTARLRSMCWLLDEIVKCSRGSGSAPGWAQPVKALASNAF